ncbi:flagellar basal body P-ring protein FlgI [Methylococcus sp. EFPC2]|uniref:flagellar basal body P-ring protein FlgI n=1 Tax=Methylococcus sp. EFPC2 TaxID=2812648 RepID=UPI00196837FA|nr:flagellar basal body P-ring protein FlgI [Methylococcus sp. EFPC2]QSA98368.1 flagellar basal body P-ring protein FlgI [Methylococcus sp. EFPC2]
MNIQRYQRWASVLLALAIVAPAAQAERIKDLTQVAGVRSNQLIGYGLVVGLTNTGDKTRFTSQALRNMMNQLGITLPAGIDLRSKNIAVVSVQAELPAFSKPGQTIDVNVGSLGDAKSLRGGSLLMTPLKGADGQVYAIAQGNLVVGGLSASGQDGSKITVNVPSSGRIPNGATVEREVPTGFAQGGAMVLNLHTPDFSTANQIAAAINRAYGEGTARPIDGSSVQVAAPRDPAQRVSFASMVENLNVSPGDAAAKVVVNSRTGTVVISNHVRVQPAAVSHGNLTVTITERPQVSQPGPFAGGQTVVTPKSDINVQEEANRAFVFNPGVTLDEIVNAVNKVGAAPSDLVAILEALKSAGALRAELIVI